MIQNGNEIQVKEEISNTYQPQQNQTKQSLNHDPLKNGHAEHEDQEEAEEEEEEEEEEEGILKIEIKLKF